MTALSPRNLVFTGWVLAAIAGATLFALSGRTALGQTVTVMGDAPDEVAAFDAFSEVSVASTPKRLQILPDGLIYHPYLAGPKESRTGTQFSYEQDAGWSWYSTVGGQLGLLRYGTEDPFKPVGIEFDVEASAQFKSIDSGPLDILASDLRWGFPLSIGWGKQETKLAFYFLRTHPNSSVFDLLTNPPDRFFERRAIVLGHAIHPIDQLRIYGEVGYAYESKLNGQWEFQFGAELAPVHATNILGAPFAAANVYLLEVDDYAGTVTLQAGWAWRSKNARLLRIGAFYANGLSSSFVLADRNERTIGFGIWHDF